MPYPELLDPINHFLKAPTPNGWIFEAKKTANLPIILSDHLLCELKAAQSAMFLLRKYALEKESAEILANWLKPYEDFAYKKKGNLASLKETKAPIEKLKALSNCPYADSLTNKMLLLIKEELHHFSQVMALMEEKEIPYQSIPAGRYAKSLLKHVKHHEPDALIDKLIIGALIEARSCERFSKLAPHLDKKMRSFYISLLRSEARHYQDYLSLAAEVAGHDIHKRIDYFAHIEAQLIITEDIDFRFHSGLPPLTSPI